MELAADFPISEKICAEMIGFWIPIDEKKKKKSRSVQSMNGLNNVDDFSIEIKDYFIYSC